MTNHEMVNMIGRMREELADAKSKGQKRKYLSIAKNIAFNKALDIDGHFQKSRYFEILAGLMEKSP